VSRVRACALQRFACLREAAPTKAGRAGAVRVQKLKENEQNFDKTGHKLKI
jgi:hypothetical protein